eukprot:1176487-Prorocentrum_minimum.AAC.2
MPFVAAEMPKLRAQGYDLCTTGDAMRAAAAKDPQIWEHVEEISVYARMAPEDKEKVLRVLRDRGQYTLMCGDGANDVGALKQAHVGVALLSGFGSANTAKDGEKALELESEEERKKRQAQAKVSTIARDTNNMLTSVAKSGSGYVVHDRVDLTRSIKRITPAPANRGRSDPSERTVKPWHCVPADKAEGREW